MSTLKHTYTGAQYSSVVTIEINDTTGVVVGTPTCTGTGAPYGPAHAVGFGASTDYRYAMALVGSFEAGLKSLESMSRGTTNNAPTPVSVMVKEGWVVT